MGHRPGHSSCRAAAAAAAAAAAHQINDILGAHALGIEVLWFNNTRAVWEQDFEKPDQFYDWQNLAKIIEEKYESR